MNLTQTTTLKADSARSRADLARNWVKIQPSLMAFVVASTPQFSDAEDLLQEVAAEVALRYDEYDSSRPFLPWALWIAKLKIADYYRGKRRDRVLFMGEAMDALADACSRVQRLMTEERDLLEYCLDQLTERSRRLLGLRYTDDLKPKEIASELGTSTGSVRVTLSRIRTSLMDCVQKRAAGEANVGN